MLPLAICPHQRAGAETLAQVVNPKKARSAWVSDTARVIDSSGERRLNSLIDRLERRTTAEIAVVTIHRSDGHTPKQFATRLFNLWEIGKKGKDNGVLVLVVMEPHRIEVETGNGMGGILPNSRVQAILEKQVVPRFKEDDYSAGIYAGVQAMAQQISSAPAQTVAPPRSSGSHLSGSRPPSSRSPSSRLKKGQTSKSGISGARGANAHSSDVRVLPNVLLPNVLPPRHRCTVLPSQVAQVPEQPVRPAPTQIRSISFHPPLPRQGQMRAGRLPHWDCSYCP
jgi:uncharacterized membrane protein